MIGLIFGRNAKGPQSHMIRPSLEAPQAVKNTHVVDRAAWQFLLVRVRIDTIEAWGRRVPLTGLAFEN